MLGIKQRKGNGGQFIILGLLWAYLQQAWLDSMLTKIHSLSKFTAEPIFISSDKKVTQWMMN